MKTRSLLFVLSLFLFSCKPDTIPITFSNYDETSEVEDQQSHDKTRMQFKLIQSKYLDMNEVFAPFEKELNEYSEKDYLNSEPFIIEKDIPSIQESVSNGILTYEKIVLFYLYRIRKYESDHTLFLNGIISLNPNVLEEARELDKNRKEQSNFSLYGMPILLKDNINTEGMATTAGSVALKNNLITEDAFIVKKLKEHQALVLGKANLSEWAYFFCSGCPLGYSAIGGQTLNPYGRKIFETGGSSSGSGVSVAANYAVAAVGTETSGSILSPSSKNSVVGLKPTIGLLSRGGIVPISSTLDTPGPMTKNVIDNAIFLTAMLGEDLKDPATIGAPHDVDYLTGIEESTLKGKRFGVMKSLLKDSIYKTTVKKIENAGGILIEYDPPADRLKGFTTLLNIDMKNDLPSYLVQYADSSIPHSTVKDVVGFNLGDSLKRAPYGQKLFEGIVEDSTSKEKFDAIKSDLMTTGKLFFDIPFEAYDLDVVLSINNFHAGYAAVAQYPCLTIPMGYTEEGEPMNLTFIGTSFSEKKLLQLGYAYEKILKIRVLPKNYQP